MTTVKFLSVRLAEIEHRKMATLGVILGKDISDLVREAIELLKVQYADEYSHASDLIDLVTVVPDQNAA